FQGERNEFYESDRSTTAAYLTKKKVWLPDREPRPVDLDTYRYVLEITGCRGNNLKNIDVKIPLNRIVAVTGVSGSGKSSLISGTLYPAVARELGVDFIKGLEFKALKGTQHLKNVLFIDQSPIGT